MSAVPNIPETIHHGRDQMPDAAAQEVHQSRQATTQTNGHSPDFKMHDTVIENFRPIKVIVIGAGYSGIYCGIRIPERFRNCELVIYEKNAGVGGTW